MVSIVVVLPGSSILCSGRFVCFFLTIRCYKDPILKKTLIPLRELHRAKMHFHIPKQTLKMSVLIFICCFLPHLKRRIIRA